MSTKQSLMLVNDDGETTRLPSFYELLPAVKDMDDTNVAALLDRMQTVSSDLYQCVKALKSELAGRMEKINAKALKAGPYEVTLEPDVERIYLPGLAELPVALESQGLAMPEDAKGNAAVRTELKADWRLLKGLLKYGGAVAKVITDNTLEQVGEPKVKLKRNGG